MWGTYCSIDTQNLIFDNKKRERLPAALNVMYIDIKQLRNLNDAATSIEITVENKFVI